MSAIRAILDTNILVSALLSPFGNPAKIYRMFLTGRLHLVICEEILLEYDDVLRRPKLHIPAIDADTVITAIRQYAEIVQPMQSVGVMPDEDDRVFYDTAKAAGAYLVTGNTNHFPQEPFILSPAEFVAMG
jgi:putative PIN family toxin of toxin-antitoxin system